MFANRKKIGKFLVENRFEVKFNQIENCVIEAFTFPMC